MPRLNIPPHDRDVPGAFRCFLSSAAAPVAVTTVLLLALGLLLAPGAVWITDNGNKYMVMRSFLASGSLALGRETTAFFPCGGFHFQLLGGAWRTFYLEYLPLLTAPFYAVGGERAVALLPMICAVLMLLLFRKLNPFPLWEYLLIPATPLVFYGLLFWEMVPGCLLVLAALLLLYRRRPDWGGAVLAASLLMREEAYFAAAALVLTLLLLRQWSTLRRFLGGFLTVALGVWGWQWYTYGHPLGIHGATYYFNNRAAGFSLKAELYGLVWNYFHHLLSAAPGNWLLPALGVLMLAAGAVPNTRKTRRGKLGLLAAALGGWLLLTWELFHAEKLSYAAAACTGLVTTLPVLAGWFLNWREILRRLPQLKAAAAFALVYTVLVPPLLTRSDVGLVWGARHFLCLLPVLLILSAAGFRMLGRRARPLLAAAVLLSLALQGFGIFALDRVSRESRAVENAIAAAPETVVASDVYFLPEQTPRLFFLKRWCYLKSDADVSKFLAALNEHKIDRFVLVLSLDRQFRALSNAALLQLLNACPPAASLQHLEGQPPHSGFLKLVLCRCQKR